MKVIIAFALISLCSVSAFIFPRINAEDAQISYNTDNNQFTEYEAVAGFIRGYVAQLGLGAPKDVIYCYDQASAVAVYNYLYGAATISANTNANTVVPATATFWANISNRLYDKLSSSVVNCINNSKDMQAITGALKINPTSDAFADAWATALVQRSASYQLTQNNILKELLAGNFDVAGQHLAGYHQLLLGAVQA